MGVCPGFLGADICSEFGGFVPIAPAAVTVTEGFLDCHIAFGTDQVPGDFEEGQLCDTGCSLTCDDKLSSMMLSQALEGGKRWLRPHPILFARNARGVLHDLASDEIHTVPRQIAYELGSCWDNDGSECVGMDVCGCFRDNDGRSRFTVTAGSKYIGLLPDELFYTGHRFPRRSAGGVPRVGRVPPEVIRYEEMLCRKFVPGDHRTAATTLAMRAPSRGNIRLIVGGTKGGVGVPVLFEVEGLVEPMFLRTGPPLNDSPASSCSANVLLACSGVISRGLCETERISPITGDYLGRDKNAIFYLDLVETGAQVRNRFRELVILPSGNTAAIGLAPQVPGATDFTVVDEAEVVLKNKVLQFVKAGLGRGILFDRLEAPIFQAGLDGSNGQLGVFLRSWTAEGSETKDMPEVPDVFGPCRLAKSGIPVTCKLHVGFAEMRVSLILNVVHTTRGELLTSDLDEFPTYIYPHARARIVIAPFVSATIPTGSVFFRNWLPEGDGRRVEPLTLEDVGGFPRVSGGLDTIIYRDTDGRRLVPPTLVDWRGWVGGKSNPSSWEQRVDHKNLGGLFTSMCERVADNVKIEITGQGLTNQGFLKVGFRP